ncbi:DUF262 domain-containing protein [Flavobacterium sediminilitoris]|uniref:DUF262 domain-containing protein n=1 Tax=Flavobacterium sediminilitoris TaxID=2024526 RepID=A0ABY4HLP5_9FLAO|nr:MULTISPECIES: DUF262 domain-containing protein [Flavobacterium]UOX33795.1 DUF262 domain-containing protein [Flavobacterium sediminilitoris]
MSKLEISTKVRRLSNYLNEFEAGLIQIPPFQRDFVWSNEKKKDLLDSLKNGFPIGSVLFWKPDSSVKNDLIDEEIQMIGGYYLENTNSEFQYILDGFQRLSTLFGCFIDSKKTHLKRDEKIWKTNFDIYYDLKEDKFEYNRKSKNDLEFYQIPLYFFIDGSNFFDFTESLVSLGYSEEDKKLFINRYKNFGSKISSYDIPAIELIGGSIKEAVNIFSRLNSRGEIVSDDWKVSALSYNKARNFRFGSEIDKLFESLAKYNFYTSQNDKKKKRDLVLQSVLSAFDEEKAYFDIAKTTEELEKLASEDNFIDVSLNALLNFEKTVKFLFENISVLNSKFISSQYQLIFIINFFNKINIPNNIQISELKKWFWITSYSNYFTIYNLADIRLAYKKFNNFILNENENPIYIAYSIKLHTKSFPRKINFGSARGSSLALFMVNYSINKDNILNGISINSNEIKGVAEYKLFKDENVSENVVFVVEKNDELNNLIQKNKDLSFLLNQEYIGQYSELFITDEMREAYADLDDKKVLELRLKLIMEKEELFVKEELNILYIK